MPVDPAVLARVRAIAQQHRARTTHQAPGGAPSPADVLTPEELHVLERHVRPVLGPLHLVGVTVLAKEEREYDETP